MPEIAPIVGQPVAYGMAFAMAALYVFATYVGRYPLVLAHEGGHMLANILTLRPIVDFELHDEGGGVTRSRGPKWGISNPIVTFAGYPTPPLLGLGGAALIADGNAWGVLILALILCVLALVPARKWRLAFVLPSLIVLGIGWTLIDGTPEVRAAVAVGIVWYLLLGAVIRNWTILTQKGDAESLQKSFVVVPGIVWKLLWIVIGLVCLIKGGALLLARS